MDDKKNRRGSIWHRWDPHIHAPGTILANNFGQNAWEPYLQAIEQSSPCIRALGITDYYSFTLYEQVVAHKNAGRLQGVELIFPNVEMRFEMGTSSDGVINFHLLVCPDEPDHLEKLQSFMRKLTFEAHGETYACDRDELIRLGRTHKRDPNLAPEAALREGTNQFKVSRSKLRDAFDKSEWAQRNILVGVAAGEGDGTAGLQGDTSLATMRKEIEKAAHFIFGSSQKLRDFWLGLGAATLEQLILGWGGRKPCLHGSDAHSLGKVGKPDNDLYTWIKGDVTFESLRQVVLEPSARVFVGPTHPIGALSSEVIERVTVTNASWFSNGAVDLNAGLVAIIGARGSGKTALAEIIAAGAYAARQSKDDEAKKSFLYRAAKLLGSECSTLKWALGDETYSDLRAVETEEVLDDSRVRYLSQQFVDRLCSAEGITDELLTEIERVVFQAHPEEDRMEAANFGELLSLRAERWRSERQRQELAIVQTSNEMNVERQRKDALEGLKKQRDTVQATLEKDKKDRQALVSSGNAATKAASETLAEVDEAAVARRNLIQAQQRRRQTLLALLDAIRSWKESVLPGMLRDLRDAHIEAGLPEADWKTFEVDFKGDPAGTVNAAIKKLETSTTGLRGQALPPLTPDADITISRLAEGVALDQQALGHLDAEVARLTQVVGIATENARTYSRLTEKITQGEANLAKLRRSIELAEAADDKIKTLATQRTENYKKAVAAIIGEANELASLYEPLGQQIAGQSGALGKLTFNVRRTVDVEGWAARGEKLLDARKTGPFQGKGALLKAVKARLLAIWESGSADDIASALAKFRTDHDRDFVAEALEDRSNLERYRAWAAELSTWLYSLDHIRVRYSVQYDGVEIEQLSPGTRGIVLLLLYLSIDRNDDRPLVIDQPEENLDPKSVYDELVERFRETKLRRQIIVVTHNANLVVNTDADQVIVAKAGRHQPGALPTMTYIAGGLENPEIRKEVCEILEGGEPAFLDRAKRLRLRL
ncbi:TrlF family AAA-like ATPase [Mesorhizobium sp. M7A.F.Ca.US.006.01.1.1]|uniref:TrlF family AAA-like ATPase n=1 Tax=Mesorhizobium sp. M7A.F.Ca.US.006.01.1.1 TaxID=2496707 RepID=UPI001FDF43A0|nr:ATP-binding protein [Mesorhizobium sp. M7A.F.Ca.US.006.01.1.1]